jgi:flagella basal body P-ring formation protein FlgA
MKKSFIALLCLLPLHAPVAWSAVQPLPDARQSHTAIRQVAAEFIQTKTQDMPGKIAIKVDDIDPRLSLTPCTQLEAFLPTGAQLLGKTSIGVRCNDKNGWSIFIPASITVTINMLVSSKPLQQGQVLAAGDFGMRSGELNQQGVLTDETQALGKVMKFSIGAGQLIKQDMLRPPYVVTQGQTVQLISTGSGITIRTEGKALNNAAEGQAAQVKIPSGQVISGIARESATVEVRRQ